MLRCVHVLAVPRQFSGHSLPHENRNIRLHIVMGSVITGIAYSNSMDMGTCCIGRIGICAITITTAGNTSVRFVRTTKGKCMWMISCRVCASSMCMFWKFSDSSLCRPAPAINSNVWLHYIVTLAVSCIRNSKCMSMTACRTSFSIVKVIFCIVVSWMTVNRT